MRDDSISSLDDFEEGMRIGCSPFELDGQSSEEYDLHCSAAGIPKRPTDTIAVCDSGRL